MSGAAVEEDLGDFGGVRGDFDDVGVSAARATASQRAFSAHCVAARVGNMILRSVEAVESYSEAMEERTSTKKAVARLWLKSGFLLDSKTLSVDDAESPPRTIGQGVVSRGFFNRRKLFSSIC